MPFVWGEKYRLGINEIDRQHQTFLLLLNKAYDFYTHAAKSLPPDEVRQRVLKDLTGIRDFARGPFRHRRVFYDQDIITPNWRNISKNTQNYSILLIF